VNVDDIRGDVIPTNFSEHDRLDLIFQRQHALSQKYVSIEIANGLRHTPDMPVDIDDRHGQAQLKDFFWRVTEELTEAAQAIVDHPDNQSHVLEELADALHFLVEAFLLAGLSAEDVITGEPNTPDKLEFLCGNEKPATLSAGIGNVIHCLGCASNCLKQRPWKNTHQLTDRDRFRHWLIGAMHEMIPLFTLFGLNAQAIFEIYYKKSEVNRFRQRSNY
jgi:hypothetical protein